MTSKMKTLFHDVVIPGTGWPGDGATEQTPVAPVDAPVANLAESATDLHELSARVSVCRACPRLVEWREEVAREKRKSFSDEQYWGRPAPGFGDDDASLVIVGLAPAAHGANRTGRVFTGDRTGDFLIAAMHRTGFANQSTSHYAGDGLELLDARMLSAVRCAPPKNLPTTWEQNMCAPWLDQELRLTDPKVILALGGIGWRAACLALGRLGFAVPRPRPTFGHGAQFTVGEGEGAITVVGSFHPSQQNTFTGRLTEEMMDDVLHRCRGIVKSGTGY